MIHWYRKLYMDDTVGKNPRRCIRRIKRRRPWKKNYYAITLADNPDNLFEIMGTRQLFFRRFCYCDMYVVGLAADRDSAVELLQQILEPIFLQDGADPRKCFPKEDFFGNDRHILNQD